MFHFIEISTAVQTASDKKEILSSPFTAYFRPPGTMSIPEAKCRSRMSCITRIERGAEGRERRERRGRE